MENRHNCFVIEGRLSIFLSDSDLLDLYQTQMLKSIKSMMDAGVLNNSHEAMISVRYIDIEFNNVKPEINPIEPNEGDDGLTAGLVGGNSAWIAAGAGVSIVFFIVLITRYRYTSSTRQNIDNEVSDYDLSSVSENSDAFVSISEDNRNIGSDQGDEEDGEVSSTSLNK